MKEQQYSHHPIYLQAFSLLSTKPDNWEARFTTLTQNYLDDTRAARVTTQAHADLAFAQMWVQRRSQGELHFDSEGRDDDDTSDVDNPYTSSDSSDSEKEPPPPPTVEKSEELWESRRVRRFMRTHDPPDSVTRFIQLRQRSHPLPASHSTFSAAASSSAAQPAYLPISHPSLAASSSSSSAAAAAPQPMLDEWADEEPAVKKEEGRSSSSISSISSISSSKKRRRQRRKHRPLTDSEEDDVEQESRHKPKKKSKKKKRSRKKSVFRIKDEEPPAAAASSSSSFIPLASSRTNAWTSMEDFFIYMARNHCGQPVPWDKISTYLTSFGTTRTSDACRSHYSDLFKSSTDEEQQQKMQIFHKRALELVQTLSDEKLTSDVINTLVAINEENDSKQQQHATS
jgi:hypothetical protein